MKYRHRGSAPWVRGTPDFHPLMPQRGTGAQTRSVCPVGSGHQQSGRPVDTPDLQPLAPSKPDSRCLRR